MGQITSTYKMLVIKPTTRSHTGQWQMSVHSLNKTEHALALISVLHWKPLIFDNIIESRVVYCISWKR